MGGDFKKYDRCRQNLPSPSLLKKGKERENSAQEDEREEITPSITRRVSLKLFDRDQ
jgi:hypothetical protein